LGTFKKVNLALLKLGPDKIKVHLINGEKLSFDEGDFKKWLKKTDWFRIAEVKYWYEDEVDVSVKRKDDD
jgi:hypothetical protein